MLKCYHTHKSYEVVFSSDAAYYAALKAPLNFEYMDFSLKCACCTAIQRLFSVVSIQGDSKFCN